MWTREFHGQTSASPSDVFALMIDPATWPEWNAGVLRVDLAGPFAAGTRALMVFPDGTELPFRLTWVEADRGFADETPIPGTDVIVRVRHELAATETGTRISYCVEVDGPDELAAEIGEGVSADFPAVIAALGARAASLTSGSRS